MTGMRTIAAGLFTLAAACGPLGPDADETAFTTIDHVYVGGTVLTVDADFGIAEAFAVGGGRILAVGSTDDILAMAGTATARTDLEGRTVVPGLIDNHMHFVRATRDWYRHVRLDGVSTRAEALALIAARADTLPPGEWVVSIGGWTFEQFVDDGSLFTVAELDEVAPGRPVYLQEGYRRGFANALALSAAGLDDGGTPLTGGAMNGIAAAMPAVSAETWDRSLRQTIADMHAMGLTVVYDVGGGGVEPAYYGAVERAAAAGELGMRVFYSLNAGHGVGGSADEIIQALQSREPDLMGLEFAQFGWGESTYAPMRAQPWQISDEDLGRYEAIALTAAEHGWQLHEHSMRDEKIAAMLDVFEAVNARRPIGDLRWTIAHTNNISPASIDRANALGVVFAVHSSNRLASAEAAASAPPIGTIHASGGVWGLGSDATTVASPNPFHNIGWAVTGLSPGGARNQLDTVSREAALVAHTRSNAYLLFREADLGSLEVGKLADFVVLDRDYLSVPAEEIEHLRSVMTVIGGEVVYSAL